MEQFLYFAGVILFMYHAEIRLEKRIELNEKALKRIELELLKRIP
jgi:hypothetical protein